MKHIGPILKSIREWCWLQQDEVALVMNINRSSYSLLEHGKRELKFSEMQRLSKLYWMPIDFIANNKMTKQDRKTLKIACLRYKIKLLAEEIIDLGYDELIDDITAIYYQANSKTADKDHKEIWKAI